MYETLELLVDGEWRQGSDGITQDVINPATEKGLGQLPHASLADLDQALDAADRAFKSWRKVNPHERANSLPFGLAAYAFTASEIRARRLAGDLEAGMVGINSLLVASPETPFGGVKESGIGREAGIEGILEHMEMKTVSLTAA